MKPAALLFLLPPCASFVPFQPSFAVRQVRAEVEPASALFSTEENESEENLPSDEDMDEYTIVDVTESSESIPEASPENPEVAPSAPSKEENISFLQSLGAITGRGEYASGVQKNAAMKAVSVIEDANRTPEPAVSEDIYGKWELVYTNTQLFRSSPFFMAGRAICTDPSDARKFNFFCDMHRKALAISTIQSVRQIITKSGRLVSEFDVSAGAVPFLNFYSGGYPFAITGSLVSSADWEPVNNGTDLELLMDTVKIRGSNIPGLRQILDQPSAQLESRQLSQAIESVLSTYKAPKPVFRTTYLDDRYRMSRDQDDNVFFYIKTAEATTQTTYENTPSDLGIGKILDALQSL